MSESSDGLHRLLHLPLIYNVAQSAFGATRCRRIFAAEYVRAEPGHRVLDIGCGTGSILDVLPRVEYVGFDPNERYVASAQQANRPGATFRCSRVSTETLAEVGTFDIAIAMGVLHHLEDEEALQLFRIASNALKPGGRLVTIDGCISQRISLIAALFLRNDRGQRVRTDGEYRALARQVFPLVETRVRTDLLRVPYSHCVMTCRKADV